MDLCFFQTFIKYTGPLRIETSFSEQPRRISNNPGYVRGKECDEESQLQQGLFGIFSLSDWYWKRMGRE